MTGIAILAAVSGLVFLGGLASFSMMFSDHTPSQNTYAWPWMIPTGAVGLLLALVGFLMRWFA